MVGNSKVRWSVCGGDFSSLNTSMRYTVTYAVLEYRIQEKPLESNLRNGRWGTFWIVALRIGFVRSNKFRKGQKGNR
jgi:hypothetical protein